MEKLKALIEVGRDGMVAILIIAFFKLLGQGFP